MKLSFLTSLFQRYSLEHAFKIANYYGFEGIEIWGARPHAYVFDMDKDAVADIKNWKKKYNLEISMFVPEIIAYPYSFASRIPNERKDTVDYLIKNVELAAEIGTDRMQVTAPHPGYMVDKEQAWGYLVEGLSKLCERADHLGIKIIIEALSYSEGGNLLTTCDDLLKIINDVNSPALYSMIDVVPPFLANEPYSEYFDKLGDKMIYLHLCQNDGVTECHTTLDDPNGVLPLENMFEVVRRYGYNDWASIELLAPYYRDPETYLAGSLKVLDDILKRTGFKRG